MSKILEELPTLAPLNLVSNKSSREGFDNSIKELLTSKERSLNEKLRMAFKYMIDIVRPDDDSSIDVQKQFCNDCEYFIQYTFNFFLKARRAHQALIFVIDLAIILIRNYKETSAFMDSIIAIKRRISELVKRFLRKDLREDWRLARKLAASSEYFLELGNSISDDFLIEKFKILINNNLELLKWENESLAIEKVRYILNKLLDLINDSIENNNLKKTLLDFIKSGRYDKRVSSLKNTIIIGNDGGIFLLLNSAEQSVVDILLENDKISKDFLDSKSEIGGTFNKIVIGKGTFGKVRFCLSLIKTEYTNIGQIACVKKTKSKFEIMSKHPHTLNVMFSLAEVVYDDYLAKEVAQKIHSPESIDMSIIIYEKLYTKHQKGYIMMEVLPENTGDKVFKQKEFQKWEYQKPYCLDVMEICKELLIKESTYFSDLKPGNTIFDPFSRRVVLIDLGGAIKTKDPLNFELGSVEIQISKPFAAPEFFNDKLNVDLYKALVYACGQSFKVILKETDLSEEEKNEVSGIISKMILVDPIDRISISNALEEIKKIGNDDYKIFGIQSHYIKKLNTLIESNPSVIHINSDLKETALYYLEQNVTSLNPYRFINQTPVPLKEEMEYFLNLENDNILVILGEAGSGKSIALQMNFIEKVKNWSFGKPIPIYFNMADETNINIVFRDLDSLLGTNLSWSKFEKMQLFIDSFDEGADIQSKKDLIISDYFKIIKQRHCDNVKIILTCRTDFFGDDEEEFNIFKFAGIESSVRYITPISYFAGIDKFGSLVKTWLKADKNRSDPESVFERLKRLHLIEKMNTGFMFNIIMKNLDQWNEFDTHGFFNKGITKPEIYRRTVKCEIISELKKFDTSLDRRKALESFISTTKTEKGDNSKVEDILEVFGEEIAREMLSKDLTRVSSLSIFTEKKKNDFELGTGAEFIFDNLLLEILKLLPLKIEKKRALEWEESLSDYIIGFKHETYRNHFLLKAIYRDLLGQKEYSPETRNILQIKHLSNNREFFRYVSEETNPEFLAKLRVAIENTKNFSNKREIDNITSANAMTILVAAGYNFSDDDLSKICLRGANMRGGVFHRTKFQYTDLKDVCLRHAYLNEAFFQEADLRGADIGLFPDLDEHSDAITTLVLSSDGRKIASGSADNSIRIWESKNGQCLQIYQEHTNRINAVCFSKNLEFLISGSEDETIKIWSLKSNKCVNTINPLQGPIFCVAIHPNGKYIASGGCNKLLKIWVRESGEFCFHKELMGHWDWIISLAFSPDGKLLLSSSNDKTMIFWKSHKEESEKRGWTLSFTIKLNINPITSISFSQDGKKFLTTSGDDISIWDVASLGKHIFKKEVKNKASRKSVNLTTQLNLAPISAVDKKNQASSNSLADKNQNPGKSKPPNPGNSKQPNPGNSKQPNPEISRPPNPGNSKQPNPNSKQPNPNSTQASNSLQLPVKQNRSKSVTETVIPKGQLPINEQPGTTGTTGTTETTETTANKEQAQNIVEPIKVLKGHLKAVTCAVFNNEGKYIASGGEDNTVKVWETLSGKCIQTLAGHRAKVTGVLFNLEWRSLASSSFDKMIKIWDGSLGQSFQKLSSHKGGIFCLVFTKDEKWFLTGGEDKSIKIWDYQSRKCVKNVEGHDDTVTSLMFDASDKNFLSASLDRTIRLWDFENVKLLKLIDTMTSMISSARFNPSGENIVCICYDKTIKIYENSLLWTISDIKGHDDWISGLDFAKGGDFFVTVSHDKTLKVWGKSGKLFLTLLAHEEAIACVKFSPKGDIFASGGFDSKIKIWAYNGCRLLRTLEEHTKAVLVLAFSSDGSLLISAGEDLIISVWRLFDYHCVQKLSGHLKPVKCLMFKSNDQSIVSTGEDGSVKIWERCITKDSKILFSLKYRINEIEEIFSCDQVILADCKMNEDTSIVFSQGGGKIYKTIRY